ncbi:hypothetical protein LCGC14_1072100 [marine sediment metagenome]|uniref:Uncharacterized protein n=1 Tax=marine sediment metagenome TaxID=412755 RepID=A0A0F9MHX2_9ZZZZ
MKKKFSRILGFDRLLVLVALVTVFAMSVVGGLLQASTVDEGASILAPSSEIAMEALPSGPLVFADRTITLNFGNSLVAASLEALAWAPVAADRTILTAVDGPVSAVVNSSNLLVVVLILSTISVLVVATGSRNLSEISHYLLAHLEARRTRGGVELKFPMLA